MGQNIHRQLRINDNNWVTVVDGGLAAEAADWILAEALEGLEETADDFGARADDFGAGETAGVELALGLK